MYSAQQVCFVCEREIPLEEKNDTVVSHNDSRGMTFGDVCYTREDRWLLTEKAQTLLSAPDSKSALANY